MMPGSVDCHDRDKAEISSLRSSIRPSKEIRSSPSLTDGVIARDNRGRRCSDPEMACMSALRGDGGTFENIVAGADFVLVVVDDAAVELDPRVRAKRDDARADDQLGRVTVPAQHPDHGGGAAKTMQLSRIVD